MKVIPLGDVNESNSQLVSMSTTTDGRVRTTGYAVVCERRGIIGSAPAWVNEALASQNVGAATTRLLSGAKILVEADAAFAERPWIAEA